MWGVVSTVRHSYYTVNIVVTSVALEYLLTFCVIIIITPAVFVWFHNPNFSWSLNWAELGRGLIVLYRDVHFMAHNVLGA